jgi:heat-inducible transcriptional repressor
LESAVSDAIGDMIEMQRRVFVGGAANLAAAETLGSERETLVRVYEAMDRQTDLLRLLEEAIRPVSVRIGSEVAVEDLHSISVVAAPYGGAGEGAGSLGVIGPIRMDYVRAMAIVAAVARTLEASLRELGR